MSGSEFEVCIPKFVIQRSLNPNHHCFLTKRIKINDKTKFNRELLQVDSNWIFFPNYKNNILWVDKLFFTTMSNYWDSIKIITVKQRGKQNGRAVSLWGLSTLTVWCLHSCQHKQKLYIQNNHKRSKEKTILDSTNHNWFCCSLRQPLNQSETRRQRWA